MTISPSNLLYLRGRHETNADIKITKRIGAGPIPQIVDDPKESASQTLTWYGTQVYSAHCVVCHMANPERDGALLHNARYSLVAGLAFGLGKPLLMLSEGQYVSPIDYRELLRHYETTAQAVKYLEDWLSPHEEEWKNQQNAAKSYTSATRLANELRGIRLGEPVAENEAIDLVDHYFIETHAFQEAFEGKHTIFVGRKGVGKAANFLKLSSELKVDRRNLVCEIKPVSYDLQSVFQLMHSLKAKGSKSYTIESLWKFLLASEVAHAVLDSINRRPDPKRHENEVKLVEFMEKNAELLPKDFATRLDACLARLVSERLVSEGDNSQSGAIESFQNAISEAIHGGLYKDLRLILGKLLSDKSRVAILIDNLDKAWDHNSNLSSASEFLLGILSAANRIKADFSHSDSRRESVTLSVTIFLRSDIFEQVKNVAREPDKINTAKIAWSDPEILFRVIEERFTALHEGNISPQDLWRRYVCNTVQSMRSQDYFLSRSLPRPRDFVFFVKAALATAINRRHVRIEESDIIEAEKQYSQFAVDSILVEHDGSYGSLESIIYECAAVSPYLTQDEVGKALQRAGVTTENIEQAIQYLCGLTFLGIEVNTGDFRFAEDRNTSTRNSILARRVGDSSQRSPRFKVHPAFWAFLEITGEVP